MVRRDLLVKRLAELGVHGCMLQAIVQLYWDVPLVPKIGTVLGPEIGSTANQCGIKQGDPLSPLLFGLSIDELEQWLRERLPGASVQLGPKLLQMLLYADDLVLFAPTPRCFISNSWTTCISSALQKAWNLMLQRLRWLFSGTLSFLMRVRHGSGRLTGNLLPEQESLSRYLGMDLHETEGVSAARISSLATAATRATWAMISHFQVRLHVKY